MSSPSRTYPWSKSSANGLIAVVRFLQHSSHCSSSSCRLLLSPNVNPHLINADNYYQVNFPADDYGVTCYHQLKDYPFMYFENPADPTAGRFCLKACPRASQMIQCQSVGNITANCRPQISAYDTVPEVNKIGAFCSPVDQTLRNSLFSEA